MADTQTLDKAYHVLVSHVVETGQAHYSDLATGLGCSMEEARQLLHDLSLAGSPWTVSRNGSVFEDRTRWRSAGCFLAKPLVSIPLA